LIDEIVKTYNQGIDLEKNSVDFDVNVCADIRILTKDTIVLLTEI
jgi:hypothetical protein